MDLFSTSLEQGIVNEKSSHEPKVFLKDDPEFLQSSPTGDES